MAKHKIAGPKESKIRITPYVTLIVNPTRRHSRKRFTEPFALATLRPILTNTIAMAQLRVLLHGAGGSVLTDDGVLSQVAHAIVYGHGFELLVHTPPPTLPTDPDANLLTHLIYGEATRTDGGIDDEMAAIAFAAINRSKYLTANPKVALSFFGANDRSLKGVVERSDQWGSYNSDLWKQVDHADQMTDDERDILIKCIKAAEGTLNGTIADPFASQGGTFSMRTKGSSAPGGSYFKFSPQIDKSHNDFYGLSQ
jgi:hypothetical protein